MTRILHALPLLFLLPAEAQTLPVNDYPTEARADYVFGCMAANGQTRLALERCSCSIDAIANVLPYRDYEEAETIMRISSSECAADSCTRIRAWPRGTTGNEKPMT